MRQLMGMQQETEEFDRDVIALLQDHGLVNNVFQPELPQKVRQARDLKDGKTKRKDFNDP